MGKEVRSLLPSLQAQMFVSSFLVFVIPFMALISFMKDLHISGLDALSLKIFPGPAISFLRVPFLWSSFVSENAGEYLSLSHLILRTASLRILLLNDSFFSPSNFRIPPLSKLPLCASFLSFSHFTSLHSFRVSSPFNCPGSFPGERADFHRNKGYTGDYS